MFSFFVATDENANRFQIDVSCSFIVDKLIEVVPIGFRAKVKSLDAVKRDLGIENVISVRREIMLRSKRLAEHDVDQEEQREVSRGNYEHSGSL